jgi:hypothetical protein
MYAVAVVVFLLASCAPSSTNVGSAQVEFGEDKRQVGRIYGIHPRGQACLRTQAGRN